MLPSQKSCLYEQCFLFSCATFEAGYLAGAIRFHAVPFSRVMKRHSFKTAESIRAIDASSDAYERWTCRFKEIYAIFCHNFAY
jgi:hypothetical protein